jgi:hypothetical protein
MTTFMMATLIYLLAFFAKFPAKNAIIAITKFKIPVRVFPVCNPSITNRMHPTK